MGVGRSTVGSIIAMQSKLFHSGSLSGRLSLAEGTARSTGTPITYQAVHGLLRLIRYGLESKMIVDELVDAAGKVTNIRDSIEECRQRANEVADEREAYVALRRGILFLRRYLLLIIFQSFLCEQLHEATLERPGTPMEDNMSPCASVSGQGSGFKLWLEDRPEIEGLLWAVQREHGLDTIEPAEGSVVPGQGFALTNEVWNEVQGRAGSVLARMTVLKEDHFPGCNLIDGTIDGAPNYRAIPIGNGHSVHGVAIPEGEAIQAVIARVTKPFIWVNLREEPLIYLNNRPFVLRIVKDPVRNLEMTGIVSERVESMEERLYKDCLDEAKEFKDKLLVHGEQLVQAGTYAVIPEWLPVESIATPSQMFSRQCTYYRLPITDEQAPIPSMFDRIVALLEQHSPCDLVFNCQMGRGRTTTFMIISLVYHALRGSLGEGRAGGRSRTRPR